MSRGHGSMQNRILRQLSAGVETSSNVVQWQVAGQASDLSPAFANSFGRAMRALADGGAIQIVERDLTSFAEVIQLFPYRSRTLLVLQLRQRLLPLLSKFRPQRGYYGLAANERHVLETANELRWKGEKRWLQISDEWALLEAELYNLLGKRAAPRRLIVDVIIRGRDLFHEISPISHDDPLGPMLQGLARAYRSTGEPPVLQRVEAFYEKYVPSAERVNARLLSRVMGVANIGRLGADAIRTEAAEFLLEKDPTYVRSLPQHRDALEAAFNRRGPTSGTKFSPLLDKLLTKDTLQKFRFVTANRAHAMASPSLSRSSPQGARRQRGRP
jgi:hypothetical protein